MKFRLAQNLGTVDARYCNDHLDAKLDCGFAELAAGATIDLPEKAAQYLGGKYPGLLEDTRPVRGVAESPKLKGVAETS